MVLTKEKKATKLDELKSLFADSAVAVAVCHSLLKANDITDLRKRMKGAGIKPVVTKNSLVRKALAETNFEIDQSILDRPTLFGFGQDEVELAKILTGFAKEHDGVEILGGIVRGEVATPAKIKVLSTLPGREELQARVVGTIAAPLSGFVNVLSGNTRGLVNVLSQYMEKIK